MEVKNIIVISDTHCGCRYGLFPPRELKLAEDLTVSPNKNQLLMWDAWEETMDWIKNVTRGEPFVLVHNGDVVDGVHHGSVTQVSQNIEDQKVIAIEALSPLIDMSTEYYHIRGTEAHVGKSAQYEESTAKALGAIPDQEGKHARWEMWAQLGSGLVHFAHHIGTTGRTHYETSGVMAEISELFVDSGRWGNKLPDAVVRSHRHRYIEVRVPTKNVYGISVVTPGWQLKTPFVHKIPGGRTSQPQLGAILLRFGDEDNIYTRAKVINVKRPQTVVFMGVK